MLAQLAANPNMTADQVAVATAQSATNEKTFSAVAVDARWDTLRSAVDAFGTAMKSGAAANRSAMTKAFANTRSMWQAPVDLDLYDMAFEMNSRVSDATIKAKAQAVMAAMAPIVLFERHVSQYADAQRHHDLPYLEGVAEDDVVDQLVVLPEHRLGGHDAMGRVPERLGRLTSDERSTGSDGVSNPGVAKGSRRTDQRL